MAIKKTRQRVREIVKNSGEVITIQSEREKTNINKIMAKYQKTGHIPQVTTQPTYQNLLGAPDYVDAMNKVAQANQMFDQLPAEIRKKFNHDPAQMLEFCADENNKDELISLGMIEAPIVEAPVVDEAAPTTLGEETTTPATA